jgi:hypothetical protein
MHNVNRNRVNAQEQARRRHEPAVADGWPAGDGDLIDTQGIDLNHATSEQLQEVDGLSEYEAWAIVCERTLHGHFTSWEDLRRRVPGLAEECAHALQLSARIGSPRVQS